MSDKDKAALTHKHPHLHAAVASGALMEANEEFAEVATTHSLKPK